MTVRRLLKADPATETRDASARALKADIGIAVRVGIRMGKTVEARTYERCEVMRCQEREDHRTAMTSLSACSAVPELCPG